MSCEITTPGRSNTVSSKAYTISGVPILFPFRAYPSQITMMDKIIKCLNKRFNCLLESPTGSGKSLALLCASLAWQKKMKKIIDEYNEQLDCELNSCGINIPDTPVSSATDKPLKPVELEPTVFGSELKEVKSGCCSKSDDKCEKGKRGIIFIDDDFNDFRPIKKYRNSDVSLTSTSDADSSASSKKQASDFVGSPNEKPYSSTPSKADNSKDKSENVVPTKLPRIYFGTRTHKQIEQIIRELKKTPYKECKMTILSSRERACIHPEASHADNKNEACEELLKAEGGPACRFFKMSRTVSHYHPRNLDTAFDLEDFVKTCKKAKACPYFSARELLSNSDIVFCPYNYLVDPIIRNAMKINLKGCIVIMDEAHNIEDSARDAASSSITLFQLEEAILNLERVGRLSQTIPDCYLSIAKKLSSLTSWLKSNINNLTDYVSFNSSCKVYSGDNLVTVLNYADLGPDMFKDFISKLDKIVAEENDPEAEKPEPTPGKDEPNLLGSTVHCLQSLAQTLTYLYKNELVFIPDYRLVVLKVSSPPARSRRSITSPNQNISINFWCMNPAVAFSDFKGVTHSVIVASGTLSPMTSFQSELGIPFQITLEANHVVSTSQVWVGTVSKGPNNSNLSATFQNSATFAFQDDVGLLVLEVCSVIPRGVLCFLPSYGMLERLVSRWQQTGLWEKLEEKKVVLSEPRRQTDFLTTINEFYAAVEETEDCSGSVRDGALLLAVCRGKVSEGLDFADSNARAVITVGIPFPNIKDAQVDLKRKYNDMYSSKKAIMTGSEWYEIQAFRALNQALGRCIRHKDDYGALIIVDERFQRNNRYPNALSKWIRKEIEHYPRFSDAMSSLRCFADRTGLKTILTEE